jgi:carotenoid cleavage dioxygenase
MFNQRYAGTPYRYAYSTTTKPGWFLFNGFVKHDLKTSESWDVNLPDGVYASEAPFVPRIDAIDEDDGYLVSFLIDENNQKSECILIDCKDFAAGPIVRIALPHKICSGTHSTWADRRFIEEGHLVGR